MSKPKLFMTGGTGFIGQGLCQALEGRFAITVLTRDKDKARKRLGPDISLCDRVPDLGGFDAVVNLAGEPIADKRWTPRQKQRMQDSRWRLTEELVAAMAQAKAPPRVFISGSAVGYYGPQPPEVVVSEAFTGVTEDFGHALCAGWEARARQAQGFTRVCLLRTGMVLGRSGGALKKMLPAFRLGLGGPVGKGEQILSWIAHADMVRAIVFLLDRDDLSGPFDCTAPSPVSSRDFAKALGRALHRPALLPLPAFVPKLLLGEGATLLLDGQKVIPKRLLEAGFEFLYPELDRALEAILA
ncbi:TIGR01777 family oxidoreductase [Gallaecimonas kandeliae]|uniref:TIGR01777 family oxidoreductase n=1 Tax=Gallaecimonas kandeliae TaxID=3029055 RepID=UPI0026473078|nr:TIGR01777 family oxidoreductase [Gallaecimonas kandeliae]WKE64240.1 TIGR01777 family oxidoreductase [Gallaecimonas kandeliae]